MTGQISIKEIHYIRYGKYKHDNIININLFHIYLDMVQATKARSGGALGLHILYWHFHL